MKHKSMEINKIDNKQSISVYLFDELKKMKFNEFEIYLGSKRPPYYLCKGNEYIPILVQKEHYESYGLIAKKRLNVQELLNYSEWTSLEVLIENTANTKELYYEIYKIVKLYLENDLLSKEGDFILGDFQFSYIIDGVETELEVSSKNKRIQILGNFINYFFWIYIISVIISFFIDLYIGIIVLFFPALIYTIWVLYKVFIDFKNELKYKSDGKNLFLFYLIEFPYKVVYYTFYLTLILGWYIIPGYFIYRFYNNSSSNYDPLNIIGFFWFCVYIYIMTSFGSKLLKYKGSIENKIKSYF